MESWAKRRPSHQVLFQIDEGGHQLCGVDVPAAHLQKVGVPRLEHGVHQLLRVVNPPHGDDGVSAVVGADDEGLGVVIGNTPDAKVALHLVYVLVELGAKGGVLDVVDGPVKAGILPVHRHARTAGAQVGVVVRAEKQVQQAVLPEATPKNPPIITSISQSATNLPGRDTFPFPGTRRLSIPHFSGNHKQKPRFFPGKMAGFRKFFQVAQKSQKGGRGIV